jgi:acetylornithine deacetylase/succinyl-diaminopimelate desuccinylase-like protein
VSHAIDAVAARPEVRRARAWLEQFDSDTLAWQRALAAIPAPTGNERRRADAVAGKLAELGVSDTNRDEAGNLIGRGAAGDGAGTGVVVAAHLDTVFPEETDLTVRQHGARLSAPGISDNARGLAGILALAGACRHAGIRPPAPITVVATAGEEGAGDLAGARYLFLDPGFHPAAFIALDGAGIERVVHRALGSRRLRAVFHGPGGHSWAAFGVANPIHAVGLASAAISELALPSSPRTTASVVRIGGGSGLNTIPQEAWLELDLRSEAEVSLDALYGAATEALARALDASNRRRSAGTAPLTLQIVPLGSRPSGVTEPGHALVQDAVAATRLVGHTPDLAAASTDANVAISRGVPGIALGAGGRGGNTHLVTEWYENVDGPSGIYRALLVACAAAGLAAA